MQSVQTNRAGSGETPEGGHGITVQRTVGSPEGLDSSAEAKKRLEKHGPNALEEKNESALLKFLGYFWGPIPWMIEVAAVAFRHCCSIGWI